MKYDILVQTFTCVHPILSVYILLVQKQYLPKKKIDFFSPKILSKSFLGYYKTKKRKEKKSGMDH